MQFHVLAVLAAAASFVAANPLERRQQPLCTLFCFFTGTITSPGGETTQGTLSPGCNQAICPGACQFSGAGVQSIPGLGTLSGDFSVSNSVSRWGAFTDMEYLNRQVCTP